MMSAMAYGQSRRDLLAASASLLTTLARTIRAEQPEEPAFNAGGERVGEVQAESAIVHARLTLNPTRNNRGWSFPVHPHNLNTVKELSNIRIPAGMNIAGLEGACPGKAGKVRLHYATNPQLDRAKVTEWFDAAAATDFVHQFKLTGLSPDTRYHVAIETKAPKGDRTRRGQVSAFRTAPAPDQWRPVKFHAVSCQDYACRDLLDGYKTYRSMAAGDVDFVCSIGDNVYYDLDLPFAINKDIARFHWHRMYSQPKVMDVFLKTSGYWLKDDHDSHEDDNWVSRPSQRVKPMTYTDLAPVFVEQVPMGPSTYRRARWGKALELFFVENRDFRSPNPEPDGPNHTLWGQKQKQWLMKALLESDADFRVLISPNCIVGPDPTHGPPFKYPGGGADSHGDGGYAFEAREFKEFIRGNRIRNFITINGDRHWQYHSVDIETGMREFCTGAVTDRHSVPDPYKDDKYHRFLRPLGGYLSVAVEGNQQSPRLAFRLHTVTGEVKYETSFGREG
ncbi:MAG: hypothetical protein FJW39_20895 [Acidobacteria bacterium]|nr:hypothetical protein [Acidobacteriota bacterium]